MVFIRVTTGISRHFKSSVGDKENKYFVEQVRRAPA
jgi:hypothetical protein